MIPMGVAGEEAVLKIIAANLQAVLNVPVDLLSSWEEPEFAYHRSRSQYNAALILNKLAGSRRRHPRVLGVVNVDLFIPILTHVYGEAQMGGRAAVVSLARLRKEEKGGRVCLDTFYQRAVKVAIHEMAHTFDLVHCRQAECVMRLSMNPDDLDELSLYFCDYCQAFLREAYRRYEIRPLTF